MERGKRKIRTGVVIRSKTAKTVMVEVERSMRHPLYQKVIRLSKKLMVHDENQQCVVGDLIEIMETRPISKNKGWRVVKVIGKGKVSLRELPKTKEAKEEAISATEEKKSDTTA